MDTCQSQPMDYNTFKIGTVSMDDNKNFHIDTVQIEEAINTAKLFPFSDYDSDCSSF